MHFWVFHSSETLISDALQTCTNFRLFFEFGSQGMFIECIWVNSHAICERMWLLQVVDLLCKTGGRFFYLFFKLMIIDFLSSLLTILSCEMVFNWFLQCLLLNPCIWVNCSDLIMGWSWFILVWSWKFFRFHDGTRSRPDQDQLQLEGSLCICSCFQTQPSHTMLQLKSNHDLDNLTGVLGFQRCTPEL